MILGSCCDTSRTRTREKIEKWIIFPCSLESQLSECKVSAWWGSMLESLNFCAILRHRFSNKVEIFTKDPSDFFWEIAKFRIRFKKFLFFRFYKKYTKMSAGFPRFTICKIFRFDVRVTEFSPDFYILFNTCNSKLHGWCNFQIEDENPYKQE